MSNQNPLESVIGVNEASDLWGLTPGTIKNYCAEGSIICKKIGKQWIIWADQPNPVKRVGRLESVRAAKQQEAADEPQAAAEGVSLVEDQPKPEEPAQADPVPLLEDVSYFRELYQEGIEWSGMDPEEAAAKVQSILVAYGYDMPVIEDAMTRIRKDKEGEE